MMLVSCANEINIEEAFSYTRSVVVDGRLTDENKVHEVRLSYSVPVNEDISLPISGANVWVEDDLGGRINYEELGDGNYATEQAVQGEVGRSYKLVFTTEDGITYESTSEELISSPPVSRFYAEYINDPLISEEQGLQFFVDVEETGNSQFFRYEWNDAAQIIVPLPGRYNILKKQGPEIGETHHLYSPREILPDTCFRLGYTGQILLNTTVGSSDEKVLDSPIRFIELDSLQYVERYSIEVKQFSMTKAAYDFYRNLRQYNEYNGSLFDRQQGVLNGNIKRSDDENEVVLGYFQVSGVSSTRLFFDSEELETLFSIELDDLSDTCEPDDIREVLISLFDTSLLENGRLDGYADHDAGEIAVFYEPPMNSGLEVIDWAEERDSQGDLFAVRLFLAHVTCIDCRRYTAERIVKPAYWIQ